MKKKLLAFLLICATLVGAASCAFPGMTQNNTQNTTSSSSRRKRNSSSKNEADEGDSSDDSSSSSSVDLDMDEPIETDTVAECNFVSLYSDEDAKTVKLGSGESKKIDVNEELGCKSYLRLRLKSNANLLGKFTYCETADEDRVITEEFYIEPSTEEIEFRQFLDSFRPNGVGVNLLDDATKEFESFDKTLISVSFKNLDEQTANIAIYEIEASNRAVPSLNKEIYLENGGLKVGADLAMGGTLSYLEKLSYGGETIDEIIDTEGNVTIGVGAGSSAECEQHLSSSVNLINIYDAGREFQQSYYAAIGGTQQMATGANGYQRYIAYTADPNGYYWPYNPVQGGDEVCNLSQIIDYEVRSKEIYIKVRALDWANGSAWPDKRGDDYELVKNGRTTKSYIENWYAIRAGMLEATNRFIDWNGFTDMENIPAHNLEIPAAYVVHPLSNYVCYTGTRAWDLNDDSYDRQPALGNWANGSYVNDKHPEDWFAWVNDSDFGVGVYIPGARAYCSGRSRPHRRANDSLNKNAYQSPMANEFLYNKPTATSQYTSCYVSNTCYTAPVVTVRMKEYVALSYTYVIAVDYLDNMRASFKEYYENGTIDNSGLKAWD